MKDDTFSGDKKVGQSILSKPEKQFIAWAIPKIPKFVGTRHLTLLTLVWSVLNVCFGFFAVKNSAWLWMVSLMIVLQYITDSLDGSLGKYRKAGLIKWGFYMDHFLDYVFLCSLVTVGYLIAPKGVHLWFLFLLVIAGGFMVNSFLSFAATGEFEIYYFGIGPTEMRIVFIIINTVIIFAGTAHFKYSVPMLCVICFVGLIVMVCITQSKLWEIDTKKNMDR